jgi:hypothetical protein
MRLVEALTATPHEAIELYERAGYQAPVWPTTASDFRRIRTELQTHWLRDGPPASVVTDVFWRVWHVNGAFARLFTSKPSSELAGIHFLKLCLDPAYGFREAISRLVVDDDVDVFLRVVTSRFRRRVMSNRGGVASEKDLDRVRKLPGFDDLWERSGPGSTAPGDHFLDFVRLRLRGGGEVNVQSTSIVSDRRFLFTNYLPTDERAAMTLGAILSSVPAPGQRSDHHKELATSTVHISAVKN